MNTSAPSLVKTTRPSHVGRKRSPQPPNFRTLRGAKHPDAPLREFGEVLCQGGLLQERRWLVDNRSADGSLPLVELARFANIARSHLRNVPGVSIAWVSATPLSRCLSRIFEEMPLRFREFGELAEAQAWLARQP
jgi:hypothetical protein